MELLEIEREIIFESFSNDTAANAEDSLDHLLHVLMYRIYAMISDKVKDQIKWLDGERVWYVILSGMV